MEQKACGRCCTKIKDISVKIGNKYVIQNVNIHIHCGHITCIIGKNGAGKSTLLKAIIGEIKHEGNIEFIDKKINIVKKLKIGYVPQKLNIDKDTPMSVLDIFLADLTQKPICMFKSKDKRKYVLEHLTKFGLDGLIDKRLGQLSGGETQRVLVALATIDDPELLILDEPISGVDIKGKDAFYNLLNNLKQSLDIAIILVSHDFGPILELADQVILLDKQVILKGSPKEVFESSQFKDTFGVNVF